MGGVLYYPLFNLQTSRLKLGRQGLNVFGADVPWPLMPSRVIQVGPKATHGFSELGFLRPSRNQVTPPVISVPFLTRNLGPRIGESWAPIYCFGAA